MLGQHGTEWDSQLKTSSMQKRLVYTREKGGGEAGGAGGAGGDMVSEIQLFDFVQLAVSVSL